MKNKAKFFFLGYFSHQTAKQAQKRGLGIMFLGIILSVLLFLFGLIASSTLPVRFLYQHAGDLRATVEKTFADVDVTVLNGKIVAGTAEQGKQLVVNTVISPQDQQRYSVNGFDVVVDTRPVELFDDFIAVCVTERGKEISYEDYLSLDSEVQSLYTFQVKYSGKERVIGEEWKARCEAYLDTVTDEAIVKDYAEAKKLSGEEYANAIYELYVKAYYPDLSAYETDGCAPKLRNSYTRNYNEKKNILFVFDDSLIARFTSGSGEEHVFYGFYADMPDGAVEANFDNAHAFLLQSFKSANVIIVYSCMINFMMIMPYLVFISFIVMIITYCLCKVIKAQMQFGAVAKIACNFLLWTVIFTDLITMALSLFIAQSRLFGMACVVFFVAFLLRAILFIIVEWRNSRFVEAKGEQEEDVAAEPFIANQAEEEI
ncbi:MAG: hypothetical protein J6K86_06460 [Clostridia bacterium]|nr:hypothetical protein [Clostridia bacterium]